MWHSHHHNQQLPHKLKVSQITYMLLICIWSQATIGALVPGWATASWCCSSNAYYVLRAYHRETHSISLVLKVKKPISMSCLGANFGNMHLLCNQLLPNSGLPCLIKINIALTPPPLKWLHNMLTEAATFDVTKVCTRGQGLVMTQFSINFVHCFWRKKQKLKTLNIAPKALKTNLLAQVVGVPVGCHSGSSLAQR